MRYICAFISVIASLGISVVSEAGNNFVAGGQGSGVSVNKWKILDNNGGSVSGVGTLVQNRSFHCSVALENGNVFLAGGTNNASLNAWEIRNPAGVLVATGQLTMKRGIAFTCTRVGNGNIMIVGGNLSATPQNQPPDDEVHGEKTL